MADTENPTSPWTPRETRLMDAVRRHALTLDLDNETWAYVAHEMPDWELAFQIGKARTAAGAITRVTSYVQRFR